MSNEELCFLPATDLKTRYAERSLSPVEVTSAVLGRITAVDVTLNAYVTLTPELAMEQARAAERAYAEGSAGLLAGVPISIKDLTLTRGIRTTRGSRLYADYVPDENAPFVDRVNAAGAVTLGKTNTPEFGWKGETTNPVTGSSHNPWKHGRTPGGSSGGGAAAVAAGLGQIGQGSDGAGSIRIPCGFCGIYGIKPSWALIPQYPSSGVIELAHLGPMTRTVRDAALLLDATAGADPRDRNSWSSGLEYLSAIDAFDPKGLRVAWSPDLGYAPVDPDVREATERAARKFEELGCRVEEVDPGLPDPWAIVDTIWSSGMAALHKDDFEQVKDVIDQGRRSTVERGFELRALDLASAYLDRSRYYQSWRQFMDRYDLLLTPALPCTAFPVGLDFPPFIAGKPMSYLGWTAFTYPFNLTGQPAATVPCGFDREGLPIGLQIVGRWRDDASVLGVSAAFEAIAPWAGRRPPV